MIPKLEFLGKHFSRIVIEPEAGGVPIATITFNDVEVTTGYVARCLPSMTPNPSADKDHSHDYPEIVSAHFRHG